MKVKTKRHEMRRNGKEGIYKSIRRERRGERRLVREESEIDSRFIERELNITSK